MRPPSDVGLVVDVVPCDDIVETCGNRAPHGEDEPLVEGLPQQLQHLLALLAGRQEGGASGAAVPDAGVRVLGLQNHISSHGMSKNGMQNFFLLKSCLLNEINVAEWHSAQAEIWQ